MCICGPAQNTPRVTQKGVEPMERGKRKEKERSGQKQIERCLNIKNFLLSMVGTESCWGESGGGPEKEKSSNGRGPGNK